MSDGSNLTKTLQGLLRQPKSDILVAVGVVVVVMMMIIPLPAVILDTLMTFNLMFGLLILLTVLYTQDALDFSVFPTLLLISTVFGLALNVSSTRLILSQGSEFRGKIVQAFGSFVVGSTGTEGLVIGIVIFTIIVAVQFVVITKGATRISEVTARFTLDGLPQKQMGIEAEYNSGLITEEEVRSKKQHLQQEVDFYGAMDGASKFVSGNVKVGILITVVNILGGIVVGTTLHNESISMALQTYVSLTIGDGLVSQFPTLLISVATGLIVTRAVSENSFGTDVTDQFARQAKVFWIASGFLFFLGFLPIFPWYVLMPMAVLVGYLAYSISRKDQQEAEVQAAQAAQAEKAEQPSEEVSPVVPLDPLSLELGYALIPLVDQDQGAELLNRITGLRREAALDLGLVVPRIRIIDNIRLEPSEYCVKIRGVEVGRGEIRMGSYMAINPGGEREELEGDATREPAFNLPAVWISEGDRDKAERAGYTVVDPPSIIATHLTEILKQHASDILGRQEVKKMLDTLREDYPAVVDEVTKEYATGEIQKVLQNLLREQVSIRNLVEILETLGDYSGVTKEPGFLVEKVRQTLGRQICQQYTGEDRVLRVVTIQPQLEQQIIDSRMETANGPMAALEPAVQKRWIESVSSAVQQLQAQGHHPVVLCSEAARPLVKASTSRDLPVLVVLSVPEIAKDVQVESLGEIQLPEDGGDGE